MTFQFDHLSTHFEFEFYLYSPRLISMAICALLSGLALVIFYSWNLGVYNNYSYYSRNATTSPVYKPYCVYYSYNASLCKFFRHDLCYSCQLFY